MRILNLGKATTVPKLNEDKAIETGSQLLSEFIIMSIASSVIIYEWRRSAEKEEAKQAEAQRERELLGDKVRGATQLGFGHGPSHPNNNNILFIRKNARVLCERNFLFYFLCLVMKNGTVFHR